MGEKLSERMEFRVTPTTKEIIKKYAEVDETSMGETARSLIKNRDWSSGKQKKKP